MIIVICIIVAIVLSMVTDACVCVRGTNEWTKLSSDGMDGKNTINKH